MNIKKWFKQSILPVLVTSAPAQVFAQGLGSGEFDFEGDADSDLITAIQQIVNWGLTLAAIVAAVFLIIGGVRYITSSGNEDQADEAKNTILYAIIGLIVIGLAAAIVRFVISGIQFA